MTHIELKVSGAHASATHIGEITAHAVGITVHVNCDDAWNGLTPKLVAYNGHDGFPIIIDAQGIGIVPHEVLRKNLNLYIGAEGTSLTGDIVIPTVMANVGRILPSAKDVPLQEGGNPPSPDEKAQILQLAFQASQEAYGAHNAAEQLRQDAAAGKFDGKDGHSPYISAGGNWMEWNDSLQKYEDTGVPASGDVPEKAIAQAVAAYLEEHPVKSYDDTGIKEDLSQLKKSKQDKLIAGANITIDEDGKTISASGDGGGEEMVTAIFTEQDVISGNGLVVLELDDGLVFDDVRIALYAASETNSTARTISIGLTDSSNNVTQSARITVTATNKSVAAVAEIRAIVMPGFCQAICNCRYATNNTYYPTWSNNLILTSQSGQGASEPRNTHVIPSRLQIANVFDANTISNAEIVVQYKARRIA